MDRKLEGAAYNFSQTSKTWYLLLGMSRGSSVLQKDGAHWNEDMRVTDGRQMTQSFTVKETKANEDDEQRQSEYGSSQGGERVRRKSST